jgi:fluoride exporter
VFGANLRYVTNRVLAQWLGTGFPFGTLAVNVAGSFAAGLFGAMVTARLLGRPELVRQLVIVGFLGSLTTFSAFMYETSSLVNDGEWVRALLNVGVSLAAGLAGVRLGVLLVARLGGAA